MPWEIEGELPSRLNRRVEFSTPLDLNAKEMPGPKGTVIGEVWADDGVRRAKHRCKPGRQCWGDYAFFSQLIEWDEEHADGKFSIRLGYWRRKCGGSGWRFAGQTTITSNPEEIRSLLQRTLAQKSWFAKVPKKTFLGASGQSKNGK